MRHPKTSLALLIGGLLPGLCVADPLTLDDAIALALSANPTMRVQRAEVDRARADLREARLLFPEDAVLELHTATDAWFHDDGEGSDGLALTQALPRPGRGRRVAAAAAEVAAAELRLEAARLDVARDVRVAFVELVAADRSLALGRQVLELDEDLVRAAEARFQAGEISSLDLDLARLDAEAARAAIGQAEQERGRVVIVLAALLGSPALTVEPAVPDLPVATELDVPALVAEALEHRPDLAALQHLVEAAEARHGAARLLWLPDVELTLGLERETGILLQDDVRGTPDVVGGIDSIEDEDRVGSVTLQLRLPTSGHVGTGVARAAAEVEVARRERDALAVSVEAEARTAAAAAVQASRTTAVYRGLVPKVEANLALLSTAYAEGQISLADLVVQRERVIQVRRGLVDGERLLGLALAELDRSVGRRWRQPRDPRE